MTDTFHPVGWLPYGSTDSTIILQHPLTSDPTAYFQSLGTTTVYSSAIYDSVRGMNPNGVGGFKIVAMNNRAKLDYGYQISFQVERDWLCKPDTNIASFGFTPANEECFLSATAAVGATSRMAFKSVGLNFYGINNGVSLGASFYAMSPGKPDFVTINIGYSGGLKGGKMYWAVDGVVISEVVTNNSTGSDIFNSFYVGSDRNVGTSYCTKYMRNLQVSTRAPTFPVHPALRSVGMLSDSMFNTDSNLGTYGDVVTPWSMRRELAKFGHYPGTMTFNSTGGARYSGAGGGTHLYPQLATVLATNPSTLIIRGGTNDASGSLTDDADWETQVTAYITDAFANPYVRMIVMPDIPLLYGDSSKAYTVPFVLEGNRRLRVVADTWRTANPTDTRRIIVPDVYNALGGGSPLPNTYIGQVNGLYNDLHPSALGHFLQGRAIARAIIQELGYIRN